MSELFETARAGTRDLADRITPPSAASVRERGDRRRRRRAAGATALVLTGVLGVGGTAFALSDSGSHSRTGIPPGVTVTPSMGLPQSSSSPSSTPSTASTPSTSSVPTAPATGGSASTTPSTAPSSSTVPAACVPDALTVTMTDQIGRTGHSIGLLVFQNTGSTPCRVSGYPQAVGVDAKGRTTTTAAHTLRGWAGAQITAVPTVDLAPGGYASAGIEWLNGTRDGSPCPVVADLEITPPSGGSPTRFAERPPSGADGPACDGFEVHPVVSGVDQSYIRGPWLSGYELPFASSIWWGTPSSPESAPDKFTAMYVDGASGCHGINGSYKGPNATLQTVMWQNGGKNLDERVATESLLTFRTAADAQTAFAYAEAGAVASTCHSVEAGNAMTTTVFGTVVSTSNGFSYAETHVQDGGAVDGLRTHLHYYVAIKQNVVAILQIEGSNSTTDDTSHDARVLNAMAARLP